MLHCAKVSGENGKKTLKRFVKQENARPDGKTTRTQWCRATSACAPGHPNPRRLCALSPEVSKAIRRQLGIAHRMLNVLVAKVGLQRAGIVTGVGQRIAAAVPQHVRMHREGHAGASPDPA